jgi:hypothetical protein
MCAQRLLNPIIAWVNSLKRRALGSLPFPVTPVTGNNGAVPGGKGKKESSCAEFT